MTGILIGDFLIVLFIFIRVLSMIFTAPVLGDAVIPATVKVFLSISIAYITFLTIDKTKIVVDVNIIAIAVNVLKEVLTGAIMGTMLNFVFYGISYAGTLIGFDMGLMFAQVLNPMQGTNENVIGDVISYGAIMVFIMLNGHHYLISAVVASFKFIPIAKYTITGPLLLLVLKYSFAVFTIAVKIASPILVSFFLIHIAEGIIARVIPNIQVFFISQPAKLAIGFAFLSSLIPIYIYIIKNLLSNFETQLQEIIKAMSV